MRITWILLLALIPVGCGAPEAGSSPAEEAALSPDADTMSCEPSAQSEDVQSEESALDESDAYRGGRFCRTRCSYDARRWSGWFLVSDSCVNCSARSSRWCLDRGYRHHDADCYQR